MWKPILLSLLVFNWPKVVFTTMRKFVMPWKDIFLSFIHRPLWALGSKNIKQIPSATSQIVLFFRFSKHFVSGRPDYYCFVVKIKVSWKHGNSVVYTIWLQLMSAYRWGAKVKIYHVSPNNFWLWYNGTYVLHMYLLTC